MLIKDLQPVTRSLKQTVLETSSSSTVGRALANQPDQTVLHLYASTRVVGIFVPAAPTKRYHPTGSWLSHNSKPCGVTKSIFLLASLRLL